MQITAPAISAGSRTVPRVSELYICNELAGAWALASGPGALPHQEASLPGH